LITIEKTTGLLSDIEVKAEVTDFSFNSFLIHDIETQLNILFDEDKKLDIPVFLFIKEGIIRKIAELLAGTVSKPVAVGIAGETASGKSTITIDIIDCLKKFQEKHNLRNVVTRVNTDDYYYDRSDMVKAAGSFAAFAKNYDLDCPEAFELPLLKKHIKELKQGNNVLLPKYDMSGTAIRIDNHTLAEPAKIIITEGLFTLTDIINDVFDFRIYVDVSSEVQKERFFRRAAERSLGDSSYEIYENAVNKAEIYIKPTAYNADIILNGEASREDYKTFVNKLLKIVENIHINSPALI